MIHEMPSTIMILLLLLVTILLNSTPSSGEEIPGSLRFDTRSFIKFGSIDGEGFISISVGNAIISPEISISIGKDDISPASSSTPPINASNVGFFFVPTMPSLDAMRHAEKNHACILGNPNVSLLMTFSQLSPPPNPNASVERTVEIKDKNSYTIFFHNCEEKTFVSLEFIVKTYDLATKSYKDYVKKISIFIPKVMVIDSVFYGIFLACWILTICFAKQQYVHKIHLKMGWLLFFGLLISLFGIPRKGSNLETAYPIWFMASFFSNAAYYVCTITILFGVLDKIIKPCLKEIEKFSLLVLFVSQISINVLYHALNVSPTWNYFEERPYPQRENLWDYSYLVGDQVAAFSIMFLLVFVILRMKKQENEEGYVSHKKLRTLKIISSIYFVFLVYQIIVKPGMFVFRIVLGFDEWWKIVIIKHIAVVFVYLVFYPVLLPLSWIEIVIWGNREVPARVHPHDQI